MGAACQNTPISEIESERNERKTVRESIKGKGKNCEATKKGKWRAKRGDEIMTKDKHIMVNRKNTEVQGKFEVKKKNGKCREKSREKDRTMSTER